MFEAIRRFIFFAMKNGCLNRIYHWGSALYSDLWHRFDVEHSLTANLFIDTNAWILSLELRVFRSHSCRERDSALRKTSYVFVNLTSERHVEFSRITYTFDFAISMALKSECFIETLIQISAPSFEWLYPFRWRMLWLIFPPLRATVEKYRATFFKALLNPATWMCKCEPIIVFTRPTKLLAKCSRSRYTAVEIVMNTKKRGTKIDFFLCCFYTQSPVEKVKIFHPTCDADKWYR